MPTILLINGYRIGFFSSDGDEPPHVHVSKAGNTAKVWLDPLRVEKNSGFRRHELSEFLRILEEQRETLLRTWHEYFRRHPRNQGDQ
jgi:hypothetical protein